jgi:hypothetical protein
MNNHVKNKKIYHFFKRWNERVGSKMTDEKYQELKGLIKNDGVFLWAYDDGRSSVYSLDYNNSTMYFAYDAFNDIIVTVLEPNYYLKPKYN